MRWLTFILAFIAQIDFAEYHYETECTVRWSENLSESTIKNASIMEMVATQERNLSIQFEILKVDLGYMICKNRRRPRLYTKEHPVFAGNRMLFCVIRFSFSYPGGAIPMLLK
jgi:hypothetical protein